ncbi:MAG: hypothetical protein ABI675_20030 [Chitinophagaceae bacterium]
MESLSKPAHIRHKPQLPARCRRHKKRSAEIGARSSARRGFLDYCFPPLIEKSWRFFNRQKEVENAVFNSIHNLCAFYGMPKPDVSSVVYPYNIYITHRDTAAELLQHHPDLQLHIFEKDDGTISVGTLKTFDTGRIVYYIPIQPLTSLLNSKKTKATATVIISMMAWLHQIIHVPFYSDGSNYVGYTHECIETMLLDAEDEHDEADWKEYINDIETAKQGSQRIKRLICQPAALERFAKRVETYEPNTLLEAALHITAQKALQLFRDYPTRSYFDTILTTLDEEERDYNETLQVDKYLSFHWSWKGYLGEQLFEYVNSDNMEAIEVEEPQSIQLFDTPQQKDTHDFSFEERLLEIIDSLIYVLNNLP